MDSFEEGYGFAVSEGVAVWGAAASEKYVRGVQDAIHDLYEKLNAYEYYSPSAQESLKGFIAEEWAAGSLKVDAAVRGKVVHVERYGVNWLGSPDVGVKDGIQYQLKYYSDPKSTVAALGKTLRDAYHNCGADKSMGFEEWAAQKGFAGKSPSDLLYGDQMGLVPSDKLDACQREAFRRLAKAKALGKPTEICRWQKVADGLTDRIETKQGVSRPLTYEDARQKAIDVAHGRKLSPEQDAMTEAEVIKVNHLLSQALRAGASAAAMSAAMKMAPEIYKAIDHLIRVGVIDMDDLKSIGAATLDGGATGFITGSASAAITVAAAKGVFGHAISSLVSGALGPTVVGTLVVLTVETCRDAYCVAVGKKHVNEVAEGIVRGSYVSILSLAGAAIATVIASEATIPIIIGSIVGSAAGCLSFSPLRECILSASVATGFSFFGIVEQDWTLPQGLLDDLDVKAAQYKTFEPKVIEPEGVEERLAPIKVMEPKTLEIKQLRRGIVGVNKVSYVLA